VIGRLAVGRSTELITKRTICRRLDLDGRVLDRLEELEIVFPVRRPGRERAYAPDDVDRLRVYTILVRELDVNPAGAEIILRLRGRLIGVRSRLARLLHQAHQQGLLDELRGLLDSIEEDSF